MGTVRYPTREELEERRAEILASVGQSEPELRQRAERGVLVAGEFEAVSELDVIAYLLGENVSETV